MVVGGHAVNAYGVPRLTKDLDVFIRASRSNSERVFRALARFGVPLEGLSATDFCKNPDEIFQIGVEPSRIDVLQGLSGVDFESAWSRRVWFEVEEGLKAPFLSLEDLLANKQTTGRPQDLADLHHLEKMKDLKD
ncbi:hypothetical protein [Edaphobacter sp. 12200R-103]|jgi:hypothetical protein|uniref:hypothetical protein n=1 Tax=Edaphobacter sp. 12200R-103 TaxID=2703788 RepID=UPI001EE40C31|nr:hypothetical protein [Edaphobacter sp. 12200R-103]